MEDMLAKVSALRQTLQREACEFVAPTSTDLATTCGSVENSLTMQEPAAYVRELHSAQGNSILFLPAGTGLDTLLFSQTISTLALSDEARVLFVGNSLGFLSDMYSRLKAVESLACARCLQEDTESDYCKLVSANRVLFVTFEALQHMINKDVLLSTEIALIVLDNVFDTEELEDVFNKLRHCSGPLPKVLAVVPPLFANNLEEVADVCTTLQSCKEVIQANIVAPRTSLGALEELLHFTQVDFLHVSTESDDLQVQLLKYSRDLWDLVKESIDLSFFSGEELEEVAFEPGKLEVLLQLHDSRAETDDLLPVGQAAVLQQSKAALFSHRLALETGSHLCLRALDSGLADLEKMVQCQSSTNDDQLLSQLAGKLEDPFWSSLLEVVKAEKERMPLRYQVLRETLAGLEAAADGQRQRVIVIVTEGWTANWLAEQLAKDEEIKGFSPVSFQCDRRGVQDSWQNGETHLVVLLDKDLLECNLMNADMTVRYSPVSAAQAFSEARMVAALGCASLKVLSCMPDEQRNEVQQLRATESRLKAATQLLMNGGVAMYHGLQQLAYTNPHVIAQHVAQMALELYCLHAYGEAPVYDVEQQEGTAETAADADTQVDTQVDTKVDTQVDTQVDTESQDQPMAGAEPIPNEGDGQDITNALSEEAGDESGSGGQDKPEAQDKGVADVKDGADVEGEGDAEVEAVVKDDEGKGEEDVKDEPVPEDGTEGEGEAEGKDDARVKGEAKGQETEGEEQAEVAAESKTSPPPPPPALQFVASVSLPRGTGMETEEGGPLKFTSGVCASAEAARQLAALAACRHLYHQGGLRQYFGINVEEVEDEDVPDGMEFLNNFVEGVRIVEKMDSGGSMYYTPFQDSEAPAGVSMEEVPHAVAHRRKQLHCKVCDVRATNSWNFESHLLGRKHNRRVAALREEQGSSAVQLALAHSHDDDDDDSDDSGPMTTTRQENTQVPLVTIEKGNRRIFMCPICGVSATSARNYLAHIQGKSHLKKVRKSLGVDGGGLDDATSSASHSPRSGDMRHEHRAGNPDISKQMEEVTKVLQELGHTMPDVPEMPYKCELCGIYTTSQQLMEGHLQGRKHLKKAAMAEGESEGANGHAGLKTQHLAPKSHVSTPFYCDVCDIYATSEQQLEMHFAGRRHQQAAVGRKGGPRARKARGTERLADEGPAVKAEFTCELCGVVSPNLQQLDYHYRGQKHQRRLRQQQTLQQSHHLAVYAAGSCDVRDLTMRKMSSSGIMQLQALREEHRLHPEDDKSRPPSSSSAAADSARATPSKMLAAEAAMASLAGAKHLKNGSKSGEFMVPSMTVVRQPSGNVYDNFPCVRVGDYVLPSSMDLRAYLEEVQVGVGQTMLDGEGGMALREVLSAASGASLKTPVEPVDEEPSSVTPSSKPSPDSSPSTRQQPSGRSTPARPDSNQAHQSGGSKRDSSTPTSRRDQDSRHHNDNRHHQDSRHHHGPRDDGWHHGNNKGRQGGYRPFHPASKGAAANGHGHPSSPSLRNDGEIPAGKDVSQGYRRHNRKGGGGGGQNHGLVSYRSGGDMSVHEEWVPPPPMAAAAPLVPLGAPPPQYLSFFPQFYQQPPGQQFVAGPWWPQPGHDFAAKQLSGQGPMAQAPPTMAGAIHSTPHFAPGIAYPGEALAAYDLANMAIPQDPANQHSAMNNRWGMPHQRNMF